MTELLPCPFCGSAAEHGAQGMVQCRSCGASAFGPKWNRRATVAATPATHEVLDAVRNLRKQISGDTIQVGVLKRELDAFEAAIGAAATPTILTANREQILQTFDAAYREKMPFHSGHDRQVAIEAGIDAILSLCSDSRPEQQTPNGERQ